MIALPKKQGGSMDRLRSFLAVMAIAAGCTSQAFAAQRTFVASSGNDANPCTHDLPCRSFNAAIAATTAGGEVVALDSAGYGPATVTASITVAAAPGAHAAITVFSGTGITVNAGNTDRVGLRNLYINGLGGATGIDGVMVGTLN